MNKQVYKFPVKKKPVIYIDLPANAQVISFDFKDGEYCLWALTSPVAPTEKRIFGIYETGEEIPTKYYNTNFIGTAILNFTYVVHCFELTDLP